MTRALVTGGTGFVGTHVARRLMREGVEVRCLVRPASNRGNLEGLAVQVCEGDLTDPSSLRTAVKGCSLLFHAAADYRLWVPDPEGMDRVNVVGTRILLACAAEAGVDKVIHTSSVAAVGRPEDGSPGKEFMDPTPDQLIGPYKRSKFESERVAREFARKGLNVIIVNPSTPIGSHDIKPTPTGKLIVDFLNGRMPGYVDTGMNFVDVEDVAEGHWLALQKGKPGARYILGNENLTLRAFLEKLAAVSGRPAPRFRIPYAAAYLAGAVSTAVSRLAGGEPAIPLDGVRMSRHAMYYDPAKAREELGFPRRPIEDAIGKAVAWFRQNGYAK